MSTVHFVDAFEQWPPAIVGSQEGEPGSFVTSADFPWANGQYLMGTSPFYFDPFSPMNMDDQRLAYAEQQAEAESFVVRDSDGRVFTSGGSGGRPLFMDMEADFSPRIRCSECRRPFVMAAGNRYPADLPNRPLMRNCCGRRVCGNCHDEHFVGGIGWACEDCAQQHCDLIELNICPECQAHTCADSNHCYTEEPDEDYSYSRPRDNYEQRQVNTRVRLRGMSVEAARGGRFVGVEIEAEGGNGENLADLIPRECGITGDGSLVNGVEVQTPPALGAAFVDIIDRTVHGLKQEGWDTSERCGLHVHVDMTDKQYDGEFIGRLYAAFFSIEPLLFRLQGGRRDNNSYCEPLSSAFGGTAAKMRRKSSKAIMAEYHGIRKYRTETVEDFDMRLQSYMRDKYHQSRYRATNFHSIGCHGTLEIRLHEGTLDATEILAWTDLIQSVIRGCEDDRWPGGQKIRFASDPVKAQRMFRFTRKTREYLVKRLNESVRRFDASGGWVQPTRYAVTPGSIREIR